MNECRLLYFGERALAEAFALIGFQVWVRPGRDTLDEVLAGLLRERASALVIIDQALASSDSQYLPQVREEGGRILVIEVPALSDPQGLRLDIDAQVEMLLGGTSIDAEPAEART